MRASGSALHLGLAPNITKVDRDMARDRWTWPGTDGLWVFWGNTAELTTWQQYVLTYPVVFSSLILISCGI
jgi:hypothetical protein